MSESLNVQISTPRRKMLVVNLFGGPGAGKTTCAWLLAAELKKRGVVVEYVPEYAKELVWEGKVALLDGSVNNQATLTQAQHTRLARLVGKVDVVVTDSPLLLNPIYLRESSEAFDRFALSLENMYDNYNVFVCRGDGFEQEGRIHSLAQSIEIDNKILKFLDSQNVDYSVHTHASIIYATTEIIDRLDNLHEVDDVPINRVLESETERSGENRSDSLFKRPNPQKSESLNVQPALAAQLETAKVEAERINTALMIKEKEERASGR